MKLTTNQIDCISERCNTSPQCHIVLIDVSGRKDLPVEQHCSNLFCVDGENEIIWQVTAPLSKHGRDSFISVDWLNGTLSATRFFGAEFVIDEINGNAEEVGWRK
jgi:hypothetical protein